MTRMLVVPDHLRLGPLINTGRYFVKYSLESQILNCPGYGKEYSSLAGKRNVHNCKSPGGFRVLPLRKWFGMTRSL